MDGRNIWLQPFFDVFDEPQLCITVQSPRTIQGELAEPEYTQLELELWPKSEREQLVRNEAALRRRLEEIRGEIEQETARSAARYANPKARLFPVAVTFLVPERYV